MKEQVLKALSNSLVADSQLLKISTAYLTKIRSEKGYCLSLMEIIDEHNNFSIKQAAMIQLKNTIKTKWNAKAQFIDLQDKEMIKNTIVTAIIRCGSDYRLIKLYRQVLKLIVSFQFKNWLPVEQIVKKMRSGEDLEAILHCLIGIAASFQFSLSRQQRVYLFKMLIIVLPELRNMLDKNQQTNLIYLSVKFLWKSVHYDVRQDVRQQTLNWMPLIMMLVGLENQKFDHLNKIGDNYEKNSNQFYYYHSKKWATRIMLRFFQKHAKMKLLKANVKDKEFATLWYEKFGTKCVQILYKQLRIPCIVKARYFQLKCFHVLATENPQIIQSVAQQLQYKILPPYIQLKPQDQQLANSDPIEFLNKQIQPRLNYKNLKRVATDAWVTISQINHKVETLKQPYTVGKYFYFNIKYLEQIMSKGNALQKQMAMYLLCQLRIPIIKVAQVKQNIQKVIEKYILPELKNQIMFLRARAIDIFYQYGTMKFSSEVIKQATEGVYLCLTQDQHVIVRIKAASAFNCILTHPSAKQLVKPHLKDILTIYLKLLETYDLQTLVSSLQSVIDDFATEIQPFALQLSKYMLNLFMRLFQKQNEQNNDQIAFQAQLAASACIKTVARIIQAPLSKSTIQNLQKDVQAISFFVFSADNSEYIQDLLILLNSFIYKIDDLSPEMWFFYQVIIYNLVGITSQNMAKLQACGLSTAQKNVLKNIEGGNNADSLEASMNILRNYLKKAAQIDIPNAQILRKNMLQLLFYLIADVYKKGPGQYTEQSEMVCCTALLVSYIENNSKAPQNLMIPIYQLAKFNMIKLTTVSIKLMNIQLFCLLFYRFKQAFVSFVAKEAILDKIIEEIIRYNSKLSEQQNFKRVNLGLCSLLRIQARPQILFDKYPVIFKTLFFNIRKVIQSRLEDIQQEQQAHPALKNDHNKKNKSKQEMSHDEQEDADDDSSDDIQFDEDEDYWEEMFDQNYNSRINEIDDVKYYQQTLKNLQSKDPTLYGNLLHIISTGFLINFEQKMQKAIQLFQKQQEKNRVEK